MRPIHTVELVMLLISLILCTGCTPPSVLSAAAVIERYGGGISDDWPTPKFVYFTSEKSRHMTDGDMRGVYDALRSFGRLRHLYLNGRDITDATIPFLAELKPLKELSLAGTHVTARGAQLLKGLKHLKSLTLPAETVSPEDADRLKQSLPGVNIHTASGVHVITS